MLYKNKVCQVFVFIKNDNVFFIHYEIISINCSLFSFIQFATSLNVETNFEKYRNLIAYVMVCDSI